MGKILDQLGTDLTETFDRIGVNDIVNAGSTDDVLRGMRTLAGGPRDTSPIELENFSSTNTSYSGTDVVPIVQINGTLITLGSVQTISISTFREKEPVRVLGKSYAKSYTSGPRTLAGSITFTLFDRDPFWEILRYLREDNKTASDRYHTPLGDQIPPVNIILWFSNEYGRKSIQTLYGVEFTQEGQVHSINDVYSEKTVNYVARDMDILIDYKDIQEFRNLMYERQLTGQFTDEYLSSLLSYKKNVEKQIADVDAAIQAINLEKGKRGLVSFGTSSLFGNKDLKDKLEMYVRKKEGLLKELTSVNTNISNWSKTVYEAEDYFGGQGSAVHDRLKQAPTTGGPENVRDPFKPSEYGRPVAGNVDVFPMDINPGSVTVLKGKKITTDNNGNAVEVNMPGVGDTSVRTVDEVLAGETRRLNNIITGG